MLAHPAASIVTKRALAARPCRKRASFADGLRNSLTVSGFFTLVPSGSFDITARAMDA